MQYENEDQVRAATSSEVNRQIDREIWTHLRQYEGRSEADITRRIRELEREWDMERLLQANASALSLTGVFLGLTGSRKWLLLPGVVLSFLVQHAVSGWCPPVPIFRRLGVRTRREIDQEKFALKILRGDFDDLKLPARAETAMRAARV